MAKRRVLKKGGVLVPFDDESKKAMDRLPSNSILFLDITNPRNGKFLNKYFAMLNIIKENYSENHDVSFFNLYVKDRLNMWETVLIGDVICKNYESISFGKMDEDTFADFYSKAVQVCLDLVPISEPELADRIARFG